MPVSRTDLGPITERILEDYENLDSESSPFQKDHLPEKKVIDEFDTRGNLAKFLTLTTAIDYMKETEGEQGVWQTSKRFWEEERWLFEPQLVVSEASRDALADLFNSVGWMGNQDANTWYTLCETLSERFDGSPMNLFSEVDYDAMKLKEYMEKHGSDFPFLKGPKISSLWLRLIHEEVHPLENIEEIPVPVDTHIISITNALLGTDYTHAKEEDNEEVREIWSQVCKEHDLVPVRLDQPLWLTAKYWDEWGEEYIEKVVRDIQ